ncbi:hypothetical protein P5X00_35520 [Paraburkholderia sp. A2RO-4L]|uniref:hypothetical protein n=1 Tax=Paraburkholderia sp. A2RO-4L TaxID=3028374 RepID=UPI0032F52921|nr:hypothetical protein [Burkholderia vietnamiensis]
MFRLLLGIGQHIVRLMTFRHDARGLPATRSGALYLLFILFVASQFGEDILSPGGVTDWPNTVALHLAEAGLLLVFIKPYPLSAILLISLGSNLVEMLAAVVAQGVALVALGTTHSKAAHEWVSNSYDYVNILMFVWGFFAMGSVVNKMMARSANNKKQD